jgi:hypothetical protein
MLEDVLDRDDSGMTDETDRAHRLRERDLLNLRWAPGELADAANLERRRFQLELAKRRWPPGTFDVPATRAQHLREVELLKRQTVIRRIP